MFGAFMGMTGSMEPCKMLCGRPLLPWQRKFGLGVEIRSPTGLFVFFFPICLFCGYCLCILSIFLLSVVSLVARAIDRM